MSLKEKVLQLQSLVKEYVGIERTKAETLRDWLLELRDAEVLPSVEDTLTGFEAKIDSNISEFLGEDPPA